MSLFFICSFFMALIAMYFSGSLQAGRKQIRVTQQEWEKQGFMLPCFLGEEAVCEYPSYKENLGSIQSKLFSFQHLCPETAADLGWSQEIWLWQEGERQRRAQKAPSQLVIAAASTFSWSFHGATTFVAISK